MRLNHAILSKLKSVRKPRTVAGQPGSIGLIENISVVCFVCTLYVVVTYLFFPVPVWLKLVLLFFCQVVGISVYWWFVNWVLNLGLYPSLLLRKNFMAHGQREEEIESLRQKVEVHQREIEKIRTAEGGVGEKDRLIIKGREEEIARLERTIEVLSFKPINVSSRFYSYAYMAPFVFVVAWEFYQYLGPMGK